MKSCPNCHKTYQDDANFCPEETCATPEGPRRLAEVQAQRTGVDRFDRLEEIGGGRTGEVYRATDSNTGATVALKVVASGVVGNAADLARVERELKQLQRVQSPHVAMAVDSGRTDDGRLYVAMEWSPGQTLDQVLRSGPMDLDQAKQVVAQIGQGLLEGQKVGLVHRDLAAKNVLISASGEVKLINFPIAVPVDDKLSGVAEYASPEQAQGRPVDQRSNTYSLGCILYHMLTGGPPFSGSSPRAVFDLHTSSPPLSASQRRPDAEISPETDRAILKALDKNSSRRHLTLRLFLNEVDGLKKAEPKVAAAAGSKAQGAGFAKTMLFAGGQAEVQEMVAKAIAARKTGLTPVPAAPAPQPTPAPVAVAPMTPAPAVAVAATVAPTQYQAPRAADGSSTGAAVSRLTPPPVTPTPNSQQLRDIVDPVAAARAKAAGAPSAAPPAAAGAAKGAAFRETLWFKKGDVEQMVADAKAKAAAAGQDASAVSAPDEDVRPIEDRYHDDGSLTVDDRKQFSLRTGGTAAGIPVERSRRITGEKMSEGDLMDELGGGRKHHVYIGVAVAVVALIGAVLYMMSGSGPPAKGEGKGEHGSEEMKAEPVAAPAPAPAPPAEAPTVIAKDAANAEEGQAEDEAEQDEADDAKASALTPAQKKKRAAARAKRAAVAKKKAVAAAKKRKR